MKINELICNNIDHLSTEIKLENSIGVAGLSGSGKTTFCQAIGDESKKRLVLTLPKSEYQYLFPDLLDTNFSAEKIEEMPLVLFLGKSSISSNPRSTIGTHTGSFTEIRTSTARKYNLSPEVFSFNNELGWCPKCKGRGTNKNITCETCSGSRFNEKVLEYYLTIDGEQWNIADLHHISVEKCLEMSEALGLSEQKQHLLLNIAKMNIGYLTIDRIMGTLSGGELTRLFLAEFMAASDNAVIIIDEISVGLDHNTLRTILSEIKTLGQNNQIWLIDHSDTVLDCTDEKVFFGPGSGTEGGKIVEVSPRPAPILCKRNTEPPATSYQFADLYCRNIAIDSMMLPKNRLISFTGESGCGKSTLVNECIAKDFVTRYPKDRLVLVGQDRNQSITSRSTIATFLDIKKRLTKFDDDIFERSIKDILTELPEGEITHKRLSLLNKLGLGYLTLSRKTQSLSTGEFQCVHLVSELFAGTKNPHTLFIFDEPSKGLSQNILNQFIDSIREILEDESVTIFMIEHNSYMLESSDYVVDFGARTTALVKTLAVVPCEEFMHGHSSHDDIKSIPIHSTLRKQSGVQYLKEENEAYFATAMNNFKGGVLKSLSPLARLVYGQFDADQLTPVITLDLEKHLYSQHTFVFELAGLINRVVASHPTNLDTRSFDFYNPENHCACCSGRRVIEKFDINVAFNDQSAAFWDGMLHPEIMKVLKYYRYEKLEFIFGALKDELGLDISKSYVDMSEEERKLFLYGYWENSFYDKAGKASRNWVGFNSIIQMYISISKADVKTKIRDSREMTGCPICNGTVLKHHKKLLYGTTDIRELIHMSIKQVEVIVGELPILTRMKAILGPDAILTEDASDYPREKQVALKMLELEQSSFTNFEFVLQNALPFWETIKTNIETISVNNQVTICDFDSIVETREALIEQFFSKGKFKKYVYVYEALGYKKIVTQINKIKSSEPCEFCKGKRVISEDNLYEGVNKLSVPCVSCHASGVSPVGLTQELEGQTVLTWITGSVKDVVSDVSAEIADIPLYSRIRELNKRDLSAIYLWLTAQG